MEVNSYMALHVVCRLFRPNTWPGKVVVIDPLHVCKLQILKRVFVPLPLMTLSSSLLSPRAFISFMEAFLEQGRIEDITLFVVVVVIGVLTFEGDGDEVGSHL